MMHRPSERALHARARTSRISCRRHAPVFHAVILAGCMMAVPAPAFAADYYAGKTITFMIGGQPGGGYDVYARVIARRLGNHIPGHPDIVVKNMVGAVSVKAATFMAQQAPRDGTMIAAVFPAAIVDPLFNAEGKKRYDPTKFQYLGTSDNGTRVCATYGTSKTKTYEDAQKRKTLMAASQAGGSTQQYASLSNNLTGTRFELVSGYKGTVDGLLAMERGEVEGMCGLDWTSIQTQHPDWIRDKKVNILVQVAVDEKPELTKLGVPTIWKYIKNDDDRNAAKVVLTQQIFGRPYFAPAGVPADVVAILRKAFTDTMADPAMLADAKKARLDIDPLDGEKVQKVVEDLYANPENVIENAKHALEQRPTK